MTKNKTGKRQWVNSLIKTLLQVRKDDIKLISVHKGIVEEIRGETSVVSFKISNEKSVRISFPTWRLIRAGSDDIGAKVEHAIYSTGTMLISDFRVIQPIVYPEEELKELDPKILEHLGAWELREENKQ